MFFSVTHHDSDPRFFNHHKHNNLNFNCDDGWQRLAYEQHTIYYKGYVVDNNLQKIVKNFVNDPEPCYQGNFCCVIFDNNTCTITHDRHRGFPLYQNNQIITNLKPLDQAETVFADRYVTTDQLFQQNTCNFDNGQKDSIISVNYQLGIDQIIEQIHLHVKAHGTAVVPKIFLSGGVDTLLVASMIDAFELDYEKIHYEHIDYDNFLYRNKEVIKKNYWAYNQIHHWRTGASLYSGACGDEFLIRGPTTCALWSAWHDINIVERLCSEHYHYNYFLQEKNKQIFLDAWKNRYQIREQFTSYESLAQQILNINVNDHQHWHLGNTITITPFKNLNLTKIILGMPVENILDQILDAKINKDIMSKFNKSFLELLTPQKNYNSTMKLRYE